MAVVEYSAPFGSSSIATEYEWSRLARAWGLDGVIADDVSGTDLKVTGSGASTVTVASGEAFVNGFYYSLTGGSLAVNVTSNATGGTARVDLVVLRADPTADAIHPAYKTGGTSAPALTQDPNGIWEIPLAQCTIAAGASVVTGVNVVDSRWFTGKAPVVGLPGARRTSRKGLLLAEANDVYLGDGSAWSYLGTAGDPAWTPWTPIWDAGGSTINWGAGAANVGRYKLRGKTCDFTAQILAGAIASWPAGQSGVTLPFAANLSRRQLFHANYVRSPMYWHGHGEPGGGASHAYLRFPVATGSGLSGDWIVGSFPVKAAAADILTVHGTYEIA